MPATERPQVGFCVIYRWRLRPGFESRHIAAWKRATKLIIQQRGGLGSRLHRTEDGIWYAYAQWPSKEAWLAHKIAAPLDPEIGQIMREAQEVEFPPICLTPEADFLLCGNCGQSLMPPKA